MTSERSKTIIKFVRKIISAFCFCPLFGISDILCAQTVFNLHFVITSEYENNWLRNYAESLKLKKNAVRLLLHAYRRFVLHATRGTT